MRPGLFRLLEKCSAKTNPSPELQKFLDDHFTDTGTGKWRPFKKKLVSPRFVDAVRKDERSDAKLKRWSNVLHKHLTAKAEAFKVPSQSSGKSYTVKYHTDLNRFTCGCPDFTYAQSVKTSKNRDCKHIQLLKMELKSQGKQLEKRAMAGAASRLLAELRKG
jgi:predicted nucleic acid-binding Zn finger protein